MTFKITGHSGCLIELLEENGRAFVRKSTQKPDYGERLAAQAGKQQKLSQLTLPHGFDIPSVYQWHRQESYAYFDMAYVNASDFVSFFTYADVTAINDIVATVLRWIDYVVQVSALAPFPVDVFLAKLQDVKKRIARNPLAEGEKIAALMERYEDYIAENSFAALLPQGTCHGDLTFSNMLIHDARHITLIDLLDNFIETPMQDIVKLRQDTCFFWSLQFYPSDFNRVHIQSIMHYIDQRIDSHLSQYPFYLEYYTLFQVLNYLRIIPYAKEKPIIEHATEVLKRLLTRTLCT